MRHPLVKLSDQLTRVEVLQKVHKTNQELSSFVIFEREDRRQFGGRGAGGTRHGHKGRTIGRKGIG